MSKSLTVVAIHRAGKSGKSTVSKQMLAPLLAADWIQIETFNDSGAGAAAKLSGKNITHVAEAIAAAPGNRVIDIGTSNYQTALREFQEMDGFASDVDFWVIPTQDNTGMVNDAISTIDDLITKLDVEPSRIILICNAVESPEDGLSPEFARAKRAADKLGVHFCEAPIVQAPAFNILNKRETSVIEFADSPIEWASAIAAESDDKKKAELAAEMQLHRRAKFLARNLRGVFSSTPIAAALSAQQV